MNYLFFDIECANCFNGQGKMCSFGYCLVDENFNILEQKDIIMNPESNFALPKKKEGVKGIELAYKKREFVKAPNFAHYYDEIKNILTKEGQVLFGHSVLNDLSFIRTAVKRYQKPPINIKSYDSQILYRIIKEEKNDASLEKLAIALDIDIENLHRSDYDAYLTMRVIKALCDEKDIKISELIELYPNTYIELINNEIKKKVETRSKISLLLDYYKKKSKIYYHVQNHALNPVYGIDEALIEKDFNLSKKLVDFIVLRNCSFTKRPKNMDYYLMVDKNSKLSTRVFDKKAEGEDIKILSYNEFLSMLKIQKSDLKDK